MGSVEETNFSSKTVLTDSTLTLSSKNNESKKDDSSSRYNPLEHRDIEYPISDTRSLTNLLKSSLGTGILAMPLAFKNAGLIVGAIGTIIIGYICTHCAAILVETSREICAEIKTGSLGYAETCEEAFVNGPQRLRKYSKFMKYFSDAGMVLAYLGTCCVYVSLMTSSMKQLIETYQPEFIISIPMYCAMFSLPLIMFVQIKNLKHLAPFSAIANLLFVAVVCVTLYFTVQDLPSINDRDHYFTSVTTLPSFLSTVIFAMEGIGIIMHVENTMSKPSHFLGCPGVLNISMIIIIILYGVLGFLGYLKYGPNVLGSITLNLDVNSIAAQVAKFLIVIAIFCTYGLQFYVALEIVWKYLKEKIAKDRRKIANVGLRIASVFLTVCLSAAIPKLDSIIGLVGAIFYSTLGLFIPPLIQIVFRWNRKLGKYNWILWKDLCLMIFSLITLFCGVAQTVYDMIYF